MNERAIAQEILGQLKATAGAVVMMSWGFRNPQILSSAYMEKSGVRSMGALKFTVSGRHFKGDVVVSLNGKDLYDVLFCKCAPDGMEVLEKHKDLFYDEFAELIDEKVEKIEAYVA
jgi:hypothetical protein